MRRRWWIVVLVVALLALDACSVAAIALVWSKYVASDAARPFDAAAWQDERKVEAGVRLEMADWLLAKEALTGKSRAEVVAMLGAPDGNTYCTGYDLGYYLGPERSFVPIDSEWLAISLDSDGHVAQVDIVRD